MQNFQKIPLQISVEQYSKKDKQLGNHFIYGKLPSNEKWNDERLKVLSPSYFQGKTILDIGCNQGIITIPISIKYQPKIIHGIDIDSAMVKKAKGNIQTFIKKNQHYQYPKEIIQQIETLPLYFKEKLSKRFGEKVLQLNNKYQVRPKNVEKSSLFPKNIEILAQNIFTFCSAQKYECILCLNVTKWVHLAFGDQGIRTLFQKIDSLAEQGTILILESQPWKSYGKKKNLYPVYSHNYRMILQKPERFSQYLGKIGFQIIQKVVPTAENNLKHEIIVFQKKRRAYFSSD